MGRNMAYALSEADISIQQQMAIHLTSNHYPPVPMSMVQPCIDAIYAYDEEDYDKEIDLPAGVSWRGLSSAPAHAIVEGHHLQAWLSSEGDNE